MPELSDGVVRLRAHREGDVEAIVAQCIDPQMVRWTTVPRPYGPDAARSYLAMIAQAWSRDDGQRFWAIEWVDDAGNPRFGGGIDLRPRGSGSAEVGYGLHPDARGRGLMVRALRLACQWWFDSGGARVYWFANAGNEPSWRVARACGFTRHGDLPGYLPHPDGLADAWVASVAADDDLTRPAGSGAASAGEVVVAEREDSRSDGPMLGGERELLEHWLDLYRESVLLKIAGLDAQALCRRAVPPSTLSLLGVVRHLSEVESYWLRCVLHDEDVPDLYATREHPDADFDDVDPANAARDIATYEAEVRRCRAEAARWPDLDSPVLGRRGGKELNLRWILTHLIEEYARHLGHLDLLREATDGRTGY
ncbi:hypothetical protein KILIM_029_00620 [Kineosphaera limosa NBRC 100340]|uniref:N-acetyltransferase domain-containing protein n=1 Tax=Kineosphaera limosa NBRC 100340 TaxID=1184609 RepID=K6WV25_9MICO|nr:hypothetical protein KILIM_029_00620 [Kineosphaera limosa NBRC 100340]